jgi:sensor histidine kinase YesM
MTLQRLVEENTLELSEKSFSKQSNQFWTLQVTGWLGYSLIVFIAIIRPQFSDVDFSLARQLFNLLVESFSGFLLAYGQWLFIRRIVHLKIRKTLFLSFLSASILGLLYNIIKLSTYKVIVYQQQWNEAWNPLEFGGWLMFSLTTMFVWTSIFFIMLYNAKLQKEHEMLLRAQTSAKDAQLQMLRYQLNPHFLFNTMNAISTLILKKDNDKANEMLEKLCDFFRYSLEQETYSESTFGEEIEFLNLYVSIEKVRFCERLSFDMNINKSVLNAKVPSMLLQPLVENAVKYAIEPNKKNGFIEIFADKVLDQIRIEVRDSGNDFNDDNISGFGIGIANTKARLDAMFNGHYDIEIKHNKDNGSSVILLIPYQEV